MVLPPDMGGSHDGIACRRRSEGETLRDRRRTDAGEALPAGEEIRRAWGVAASPRNGPGHGGPAAPEAL